MGRRATIREVDVAAAVVRWLRTMDWTVYQEVTIGGGGRTVDIVATRGPLVWAIEAKVSLGLAVLAQAYELLLHAHYVSVAVRAPAGEDRGDRWFAEQVVAAEHGIGVIEVDQRWDEAYTAQEWVAETKVEPRFFRTVRPLDEYGAMRLFQKIRHADRTDQRQPYLRDLCVDPQQGYAAAGNNLGQRWSPFVGTCAAVRQYVAEHPGCTAADCMRGVQHHYRCEGTARSSMVHWVGQGRVPGVVQRREGGAIRWWPDAISVEKG